MTKIIAITGKRGAGKDSAAQGLYGLDYVHMSFADPLREIVQIAYGITLEEMLDPVLKEQPVPYYPYLSPRDILTKIGTQGFRDLIDDQTWVQCFLRRASKLERVVVSDLRFLNEERILRTVDATIIRVVNPNRVDTDEVSQHRSETEMDQIVPHFTLINDGTIQDLQRKIKHIVVDISWTE